MKILLSYIALLIPVMMSAGDPPPTDFSGVDTDGPFVFYRAGHVVVKNVERRDTTAVVLSHMTPVAQKASISLRCIVAETQDTFSFPLHDLPEAEPDQYDLPEQILVLSDIEGNFKGFKMMLQGAKVVDKNLNWSYGKGHLVLNGDYFDRGLNVTECLWLVYKLEKEAEAAGGKVHFILGNHEVLNLSGNTQYVRKKYFENAALIGEDYNKWYDENSELGRWLRTKNAIEKVGDYLFCHGGLSPEMVATNLKISEINRISRKYLSIPFEELEDSKARSVFDQKTGVFWFREAAKNMMNTEDVTAILQHFGGRRVVVGHTLQADVTALYAGQVICIDLYHEENIRQGFMKTLLIEDGRCYGIDSRGEKSSVFNVVFSREKTGN